MPTEAQWPIVWHAKRRPQDPHAQLTCHGRLRAASGLHPACPRSASPSSRQRIETNELKPLHVLVGCTRVWMTLDGGFDAKTCM
jgi:hypothetical protein